jgi:hypothetical protein
MIYILFAVIIIGITIRFMINERDIEKLQEEVKYLYKIHRESK